MSQGNDPPYRESQSTHGFRDAVGNEKAEEIDEERAREILADVEYDTELGIELARDSRRLAAGEMSDREFHEKYNEAILEEFGVDDRPTDPEMAHTTSRGEPGPAAGDPNPGSDGPLPGVPGSDGPTRRSVLKTAGMLGAAAVGGTAALQGAGVAADSQPETEPDKQMGMVIDTERCIACLQCMQACNEENNTAEGSLWMYVFRYQQDDYTDQEHYLSRPCQHCSDAPCVNACPTASRYRREEDGIILTDYDRCTGCRYCEISCPYGVNYFQWIESEDEFDYDQEIDGRTAAGDPPQGVMGKCTFCIQRQVSDDPELQGTTACEDACPVDAIHFGDLEDSESPPRQHLEEKKDSSKFRLFKDANTSPNVFYIGNEPEGHPEPVDGPTKPEDIGLSRDRPGRDVYSDGGEDDGN
ncbi:anaerobic dehydrogenase iron-sulfur-binding subunit [Halalkaliarchaeum desulfuricum]|uniref:Anaerobic dehydrogenase iron-sulfur-binding subunit n=1 Tax=Halalkaliarchaeum desulfuricum TaxID=2055893 RepID=A0A343TMP6_9EURY|nr:4Fe-4S ferredoxin N-terminal domain-containing protein [Halalkaliarchaeum desulfuricum]AUX10368.1 anaerobic dehydrogenase iron-sulfur-binding subunit [Halalkaliarchaeum desulfuricum]